jgi:hypothetical protein
MIFDLMGDGDDKLVLVIEVTAAMKGMEKSIYSWKDFLQDFLCRETSMKFIMFICWQRVIGMGVC